MCSYHMSTHAPWAVIMCSYNIMSKSSNFFTKAMYNEMGGVFHTCYC